MTKEDLSITYENNIFYCTKNNTKWISVDGEKWYGEEKRIAELEKENTKLKGLVNQYKASKCSGISLVNRNMIMSDQLTKAKEIIRDLLSCLYSVEYDRVSDLEQAEQFLKE